MFEQKTNLIKKILLVEDDPFLVDIYSVKLKESGFLVESAVDGKMAIRKAKEEIPSLIILDIVLPHVDGWEILKEIKSDERLKNTPVIIFSNLSQKSEVEKGIEMGAEKYLIKAHYTPSQMVEEIKKILNLKN